MMMKTCHLHLLVTIFSCQRIASVAFPFPSTSSDPDISVIRSYTLRRGDVIDRRFAGTVDKVRPAPQGPNAEEDDGVELYYPTTRRAFVCPDRPPHEPLDIRETSFGCGKLGASVWPSAIALACLLTGDESIESIRGKRVLELGSGCGLPSLVSKEICHAREILATDFWEESPDASVGDDRLVPKDLFGVNLARNIKLDSASSVKCLDWHDEMSVFKVARDFRPDTIIGSDLVYYPVDTPPLLQTLNVLFKAGGAQSALLVCPMRPPPHEREALPEFRSQLENGALGEECEVVMDEFEMVGMGIEQDEERHKFLRILIRSHYNGGEQ